MNTIYLYDISAMIHSGAKSNAGKKVGKPKREYNFNTFPTGGLYTFNQYFLGDVKNLKEGDFIIACFDGKYNKLKKREVYPDYKANRLVGVEGLSNHPTEQELCQRLKQVDQRVRQKYVENSAVSVQVKLLRELLPKMHVTVLYDETLEADDWIYTVAYLAGEDYKIVLRADDGDLDDCKAYAPHIKKFSVEGKGELKMHVGNNFFKVIKGEVGDGIPNIRAKHGRPKIFNKLRDDIVAGCQSTEIFTDKMALMKYYKFTNEEADDILRNNYLVCPLMQDEFEVDEEPVDKAFIIEYLRAFRFKTGLRIMKSDLFSTDISNKILEDAFKLLPLHVKEYFSDISFKGEPVSTESSLNPLNTVTEIQRELKL